MTEEKEEGPKVERMAKLVNLSEADIGKHVKLHGWVYSVRTQGAGTLCFVDLGDGTTVTPVRCLAAKVSDEQGADNATTAYYKTKDSASLLVNANTDEACYSRLSFEELCETSNLSLGCSVMIIGYVAAPPEGTTQTLEVKVLELFVMGGVEDAAKYPIQKSIYKKPLAMRSHPHARFRAPLIQQLMQIRAQALFAVHEFFHNEGVPLLDPNIMTANDCEGAGEVFKIAPQMFTKLPEEEPKKKKNKKKKGKQQAEEEQEEPPKEEEEEEETPPTEPEKGPEVGLTVSSQLPLEAIAMGTGSVYTCQKSFRAEKSDTNKHLAEFLHVEYEQYFITLDDLVDQAERFVKHVVATVLDRCQPQYHFLSQKHASPDEFHGHATYLRTLLDKPFVRISHKDAIDAMLQDVRDKVQVTNEQGKQVKLKFKVMPKQGEDLGSEHEKYLVQKFGTFVFVTHWPSAIKSFYMKQVVGDGTCESFDLLAPLVGELFGGSMREWRYDVLADMMAKKGMDMKPLQWFVDLRKDGTAPHGGWGMGFDRLVMFLTNAASVRDVVPYPVYYGHCPY
ncbi:Asparagine--tRNA ligase [Seminavis robusta]|uniref:Asparagine--tRNA ligase n=1 Tax=Seminavis robusta TaxID=568900 RepID=A0A9N8HFA1_9STRA|nr:Asparagine--tRNA ligase [Seminavis robusta]|eukprot:Sro340_g121190.1 Asparagine--tRNA ligase (562) ;mRNA; r:20131-21816